jgi:hypothetical protein
MIKIKTCYNSKFYDAEQCVCMHDCRVYAILNEEKSARECEWFKEGKFNWDELEKSNYR